MQFTKKSLEKFKKLFWEHFGVELSDEEAKRKAEYLIRVYQAVCGMQSFEEFFDNKIQDEESE
jgi:hypothetical protein